MLNSHARVWVKFTPKNRADGGLTTWFGPKHKVSEVYVSRPIPEFSLGSIGSPVVRSMETSGEHIHDCSEVSARDETPDETAVKYSKNPGFRILSIFQGFRFSLDATYLLLGVFSIVFFLL